MGRAASRAAGGCCAGRVASGNVGDTLEEVLMFELEHFADGVDFLVEWDDQRNGGRLRGVIYDRAESAQQATQLAVRLQVPLMAVRDLPDRPRTATLHLP
jgi:hypothetical protein